MRVFSISILLALVAACSSPTKYEAATGGAGYSEQKIETDKYLVSFSGNTSTKREVVETYFLYRAAEITQAAGHEYFRVLDKSSDEETRYQNLSPRVGYGLGLTLGGRTRLGGTILVNTPVSNMSPMTKFEASATIITFSGERPDDDDSVYSASEVIENLGDAIKRPEPT